MSRLFVGRLSMASRRVLYDKLAHSLETGQSIESALTGVMTRFRKRGKTSAARRVERILAGRLSGETLYASMRDDAPSQEVAILMSGESSGRLPQSLRMILERDEQMQRVRSSITRSMSPAALNILLLFAFLYIVGAYVMPALSAIADPSRWTGSVRLLYYAGEMALGWRGPLLLGGFMGIVAIVLWMLPRYAGPGRLFLEKHVFPFGVYRDVMGLDWGFALASMLSAGVSDTDAIERQIAMSSPWLRSRLLPIHERMYRAGDNLQRAMENTGLDFPSPELIQDIGSIAGFSDFADRLAPMLRKSAVDVEKSVTTTFVLVGLFTSLFVYVLFGLVQIASNELGSQISNAFH